MNMNHFMKKFFLLLGLFAFLNANVFAEELRTLKENTFQVKDYQNIYVNASGTDVKIESWDKQEVYVKILGNNKAEEKLKFEVYQEGDVVKIIIKKKNSFWNWFSSHISSRVEAKVPAKFNANVETSGGDIKVTGMTGGFKFDTSGGDIMLLNLNGKVTAETSGGDIQLSSHNGEMFLSTSGGDITTKDVEGNLKAETSGGDIKIDSKDGKIYGSTSGGDIIISYKGENKGIKAETSGGDIQAYLPANFKANVHLETSGGEVESHFKNSKTIKVKRSELTAEFNNGGPVLDLETSGGDVVVEQK